jgi:hypothetical protein
MVALPKSQTVYERFNDMVMPAIEASDYIIALGFDLKKIDAKLSLEVGASLLLDKKVILVVRPGTKVPAKLASLVTAVVEHEANDTAGMVAKISKIVEGME